MNAIEIQYDIERKPDDVFKFLTDFSQLRKWRTLEISVWNRMVQSALAVGSLRR